MQRDYMLGNNVAHKQQSLTVNPCDVLLQKRTFWLAVELGDVRGRHVHKLLLDSRITHPLLCTGA